MIGPLQIKKLFYCDVRTIKDLSSTFRSVSGDSLSDVVSKAIKLYRRSWKQDPDAIEVVCKNIVERLE